MKKLYFSILILPVSVMVFAQGKNDPAAKAVLDAVSAKFKTFTTVQTTFTYKVENATGKQLSSQSGKVMMKGTKYKMNFNGHDIFCNGITVWDYVKDDNEVTISNLDASSGKLTPQKLFTNFYDKDFLYILNGDKKVGAKTFQEIELTPVDKSNAFHKIYLQIDKAAKTIYSARILEKAGNRYIYTVGSLKTNQVLADNQFIFDKNKYPGVTVTDIR